MNIVFISANQPPAICGIGDYTQRLSQALIQQGAQVTHISQKTSIVEKWNLKNILKLKNYLNKLQADVVHLQYEPFGFKQNYILPFIFNELKTSFVLTAHEVYHRHIFEQLRDKHLYKRAQKIIINDEVSVKNLEKIDSSLPAKTQLLGVGSNIPVTANYSVKTNRNKIVHFGKINRNRRLELLIEAIGLLANIELNLIGPFSPKKDTYHSQLKKMIEDMNLKNRVHFFGELSPQEISKKLLEADLAVLPFIDGASPRHGTLQACAAHGLPVISTRPKIEEKSLIHLKNIYFCDDHSLSLQAGISEVLKNENLLKSLSEGIKNYSKQYEWSEIAKRHMEIYSNLKNKF